MEGTNYPHMADMRREPGPWTTLLVRPTRCCRLRRAYRKGVHTECYLGVIIDNHNQQLLQNKVKPDRRDSYVRHK